MTAADLAVSLLLIWSWLAMTCTPNIRGPR